MAFAARASSRIREASKPVDTDPKGLDSKPHSTSTNKSYNLGDTVIATEESKGEAERPVSIDPGQGVRKPSVAGIRKPAQLLDLAPRLAQHVYGDDIGWREIVDAAGGPLRHELGISASLWSDACRVMGREGAALALAIVSTKPAEHFARSAGGYFSGMVRKAEKGELHLERTLWALREAKWGKVHQIRSH